MFSKPSSVPSGQGCRHDLFIMQTSLLDDECKRMQFDGLFTSKPIPMNGFLGFYRGSFSPKCRPNQSKYAVETSDRLFVIPPPLNTKTKRLLHAMCMINEATFGMNNNACFVEWTKPSKVIHPSAKDHETVTAIGVHATRDIKAGEEIFVNYGPSYDRSSYMSSVNGDWERDKFKKSAIPKNETPAGYLSTQNEVVPRDCYYVHTESDE